MKIIVKANGGLGNRMRVIASCIALSQRIRNEVEVIWVNNNELNCSYKSFFMDVKTINITEYKYIPKWNKIAHRHRRKRLRNDFKNFEIQLDDSSIRELGKLKSDLVKLIRDAETIYVNTCEHFYGDLSFVSFLLPKQHILDICSNRIEKMGPVFIGAYIRRGDNLVSIAQSPIELFIKNLEIELKGISDSAIYLATDDLDEAELIKRKFGDYLYFYPTQLKRDKPEGIQQALVDLMMLSKSNKIIGSYWSSFTEVAAAYGSVPLVTVKRE